MMKLSFTILGAPRTKKNSQRIAKTSVGRPFILQSRASDAWSKAAIIQLRSQLARAPIAVPVNLRALVYRDRAVGDLGNYLAGICDVLEAATVVVNDKWILGFDGSRLLIDRVRPRVEIELTSLDLPIADGPPAA